MRIFGNKQTKNILFTPRVKFLLAVLFLLGSSGSAVLTAHATHGIPEPPNLRVTGQTVSTVTWEWDPPENRPCPTCPIEWTVDHYEVEDFDSGDLWYPGTETFTYTGLSNECRSIRVRACTTSQILCTEPGDWTIDIFGCTAEPDLRINPAPSWPSTANLDTTVSVPFTVENDGTDNASGFNNALYVNGSSVWSNFNWQTRTPGQSWTESASFTLTQCNSSVYALADSGNTVVESSEINNQSATFTINGANPTSPGTPTFTNVSSGSVTVNWSNSASELGYDIFHCAGSSCSKPGTPVTTIGKNITTFTHSTSFSCGTQSYWVEANGCSADTSSGRGTVTPFNCQPDLVVEDVYSSSGMCVGQSATLTMRTGNQGNASVGDVHYGQLTLGTNNCSVTHSDLSPGASDTDSCNITPSSSGTFSLIGTADIPGDVTESDEGNNTRSESNYTVSDTLSSTPGSPRHNSNTTNSITWAWNSVSGASDYDLYVSDNGSSYLKHVTTGGTSYTQSLDQDIQNPLQENTRYYMRVYANNSCGTSSNYSSADACTSVNTPGNPEFGSVQQSSIQVRSSNPPAGGVTMEIENTTTGASNTQTNNNYWTDTSVSCGQSYNYRIRALNCDGDASGWSSTISKSTQACGYAPNIPPWESPNHYGQTTSALTWDWLAPSVDSTHSTADSYDIRLQGSGSNLDTNIQSTNWTHSGLSTNTNYCVEVRACNTYGCSGWSAPGCAYTSIQECSSVTFSNQTTNSIDLRCASTPSNLGSGSSGIEYCSLENQPDELACSGWRSNNNNWTSTESHPSGTAYTPGCTYSFTVSTRNGNADIVPGANDVLASTLSDPPGACSGSVVSHDQINWSWGDGGNCVLFSLRTVFEASNAGGTRTWGPDTTWNQTGLTPDTTYTLSVTARNPDGVTTSSVTCQATTEAFDDQAPNVTINGAPGSWQNSNATMTITCDDSSTGNTGCNSSRDGYILYSSDPGTCPTSWSSYTSYSGSVSISSNQWVCAYAEDNSSNPGANSATAGPVKFTVDKTDPTVSNADTHCDNYTDTCTVDDDTTIYFTWDDSDSGGSGIASCWAEIGDATPDESAGTDEQDTDTGSEGINNYYVQCEDGAGNRSSIISDSITIDTANPTISNPQARPDSYSGSGEWDDDTTIYFTWNASDSGSGIAECRAEILDATPDEDAGTDEQDTDTGSEGTNTYYVQCTDNAGRSSSIVSDTIGIDLTNPSCGTVTYSPLLSTWTCGTVTVSAPCTDSGSGCTQGTFTTNRSSNGSGSITISDNVNRTNSCSYNVTNIDCSAPTITSVTTSSPSCNTVRFTVNGASDGGSGLDASAYSFDGGASWQSSNFDDRTGTNVTISANQIKVRDDLGNEYTHSSSVNGTSSSCNTPPNVPTGLKQQFNGVEKAEGSWVDYPWPSFIFNLSDPDAGDIVGYEIEVDDNSDFSSPFIDYTWTGDTSQGQKTYNVSSQLPDGNWYWRVQARDGVPVFSGWADDNNGFGGTGFDFQLDSTDPVVTTFSVENTNAGGSVTITASGEKPTARWTVSDATSGIDRVELWRADYNGSNCNHANQSGCNWTQDSPIWTDSSASNTSGRDDTSAANIGDYMYGMHIIDVAGNCILENGADCTGGTGNPVRVTMNIPDPDYTISLTPSSQSVTQPNSANYTIAITNVTGGFGSDVSFTGTNSCPSGATCTLPGSACSSANYANCGNLTISNTGAASTGDHLGISVSGTGGSIAKTSNGVTLTINAGNSAPDTPTGLIQQFNGSNEVEGAWVNYAFPSFIFSISDPDSGETVGYHIQVDNNSDFSSPEDEFEWTGDTSQGQKTYDVVTALADGNWYWRVRTRDDEVSYSSWADDSSGYGGAGIDFQLDTVDPVPGACSFVPSGWTTGSVTASVTFTDAASGIVGSATKSCVRSSNGDCSVSADDNAGNSAQQTCSVVNIDTTAPTITSVTTSSPSCNTVRFTVNGAADSGSGLHSSAAYSFDGGANWQSSDFDDRTGTNVTIAANQIRVRDDLGNEYVHASSVNGTASGCNTVPNDPTSLSQQFNGSTESEGAWVNYPNPDFIFSISDNDVGDVVGYNIQVDDNSNFSSPVIDYTWNGDTSQGQKTYSVTSALTDDDYYWRVRTRDDEVTYSGWADDTDGFGGTGNDFRLDLGLPAVSFTMEGVGPGGSVTITTPGEQPTASWTVSDGRSGIDEVQLYRTDYNATDCSETVKSGCVWTTVWSNPSASSSQDDTTASNSGDYWYGLHALDIAGNCALENGNNCSGGGGGNAIRVIMNVASPDFTLSLVPTAQTITQGGTTSYTISVNATGGFTSDVGTWSISGCPTGATCSAPSSACSSANYANCGDLSITNTGSVAPGTYSNISITGTGSSITKPSNNVSLTVNGSNTPPNKPTGLLQQFNGQTEAEGAWVSYAFPSFIFSISDNDPGEVVGYHIQVDNNSGFASPEVDYEWAGDTSQGQKTYNVVTALSEGDWYWRVRTRDDEVSYSEWSDDGNGFGSTGVDFRLDTTGSTVVSFSVEDTAPGGSVTITNPGELPTAKWDTSDSDSGIASVELWRADYNATNCDGATMTGCNWTLNSPIWTDTNASNLTGRDDTSAASVDDYWYGIHVIDTAGNCTLEDGSNCLGNNGNPVRVTMNISSPDYTISLTPTSQTINQGDTALYAVSINPTGGFTSDVGTWSVFDCPSGATCTPPASSCSSANYANCGNVSISNTGSLSGTYNLIRIQGTGGSITKTSNNASLTVNSSNQNPTAGYTYCRPDPAGAPNTIAFTDTSTDNDGTITDWDWDFGDASPNSDIQNPTHNYDDGSTVLKGSITDRFARLRNTIRVKVRNFFSAAVDVLRVSFALPQPIHAQLTTEFDDPFIESSQIDLSAHTPNNMGTGWTKIIDIIDGVPGSGANMIVYEVDNTTIDGSGCGSSDGVLYRTNDAFSSADYEVSVTQVFGDTRDDFNFLAARIQDANNLYAIKWNEDNDRNTPGIYRRTGGTLTNLVNITGTTIADGSTVMLRVEGSTISMLDDGVVIAQVTDTDHSAAGYAGIGMGALTNPGDDCSSQKMDNFLVQTLGPPPPAVPTNLVSGGSSETSITLSWTDNATDESGYRIYQDTVQIADIGANSTSYGVTGLACGTSYSFEVEAYNGNGTSGVVNSLSTDACGSGSPPNAPSGIGFTSINENDITINWTDTSNNEVGFRIYQDSIQIADIAANSTSYVATGLTCEVVYSWDVEAYNSNGTGSDSAIQAAGSCPPWWNASWTRRRKITFDNSASSENLVNFPAYVSFNASSIDYGQTQNSGQDIRFVDADGTTVLDHEIETWNESGDSHTWVRVPQIDAGSTSDHIWVYYGNPSAADGQNATTVWNNYWLVWHMSNSATALTDSTGNNGDDSLQSSWQWDSLGEIGRGLAFTPQTISGGDRVSTDYNEGTDWTLSFWVEGDSQPPSAGQFQDHFVVHSTRWQGLTMGAFGDAPASYIDYTAYNELRNSNTTNFGDGAGADLYSLSMDWNGGGAGTSRLALYKNGSFVSTFDRTQNPFPTSIYLGTDTDVYQAGVSIDEFRISTVIRSAEWIEAQYLSMTGSLGSIGSEETYSGGGSSPLAPSGVVFSNVTDVGMTVNWVDNAINEDGYRIYRDSTLIAALPANTTFYDATGLSCGTLYNWEVEAYNSFGFASDTANRTTNACAGGPYTVTLTVTDNGGAQDSYQEVIDPASVANCSPNSAPNVPSLTGPTSGFVNTSYLYTANATDPDGDQITYEFDWNNDSTVDATDGPVNSGQDGSASASWTTVGVQCVRVRATDTLNTSAWSACLNMTIQNQTPNVPSNPDPTDGETAAPVTTNLSFDGGDPDGASDTVTYTLALYENGILVPGAPFALAQTGDITRVSYLNSVVGPFTSGSVYTWSILADDGTDQASSPTWTFTAVDACIPLEPQNPPSWTCNVDDTANITWDWTPGVPGAAYYELQVDDESGFSQPITIQDGSVGNVVTFDTNNIAAPETYYGRVRSGFNGTVEFLDDFTSPFDTTLASHTPSGPGTGWTQIIETIVFGSSRLRTETSGNDHLRIESCGTNEAALYRTNDVMTGADYDVSVTMTNGDTGDDYNIIAARIQDANNMYALKFNEQNSIDQPGIYKRSSGSWTRVAAISGSITDGSTVMLRVSGDTVSAYDDGVQIATYTDPSPIVSAGYAGVGMGAVITVGDDCSGQDLDNFTVTLAPSCGFVSEWSPVSTVPVSCGLSTDYDYCRPDPTGQPDTVQFYDLTLGGTTPYTWDWNFADGTPSSAEQHPLHAFGGTSFAGIQYSFEDGSGSAVTDISGNGNTGIMVNMEDSDWVTGQNGLGLLFDGANEYLTVPHSTEFEIAEGKIDFWFRLSSLTSDVSLFAKDSTGSGEHIDIGYDKTFGGVVPPYPGAIGVRMQDGTGSYFVYSDAASPINQDQWYHLEFWFGPGGMQLSLDGVLQSDTDPFTGGLASNLEDIVIGASNFLAPGTPISSYAPVSIDSFQIVDTSGAIPGWWDASWTRRRQLVFDNSGQAQNLDNFPVMVRLDSSRIDYGQVQDAGEDLRFIDSDGTTVLDHEIETWNEIGDSYVWVEVPRIDGGSNSDNIWMYYGNNLASDGQNVAGTWNSDYRLVLHADEASGLHQDSSSYGNNSATTNVTNQGSAAGQINGADTFDGTDDIVRIPSNASLNNDVFTAEIWYNANSLGENSLGRLIDKRAGGGDFLTFISTNNRIHFESQRWATDGIWQTNDNALTFGTLTYVAFTYDYGSVSNDPALYINGLPVTINETQTPSGIRSAVTAGLDIGNNETLARTFDGVLDEIRYSSGARSADWIAAQYDSMADTFTTYTAEEVVTGGSSGTFDVVLTVTDDFGLVDSAQYTINPTAAQSCEFNLTSVAATACTVISMGWDEAPGADEYEIYRSFESGPYTLIDTVDAQDAAFCTTFGCTYEDNTVIQLSNYDYYVRARRVDNNEINNSTTVPACSGSVSQCPLGDATATCTPSNVQVASPSCGQLQVTWTAPSGGGVDGYTVYRSLSSGGTYIPVATSISGQTVQSTLGASQDAYIRSNRANNNYGGSSELRIDGGSTIYRSYIDFDVTGVGLNQVTGAILRLFAFNGSDDAGSVYSVPSSWNENSITWNNAPAFGPVISTNGAAVTDNTWVEYDVSSAVTGDGTVRFGLVNISTNNVRFRSSEYSVPAEQPELVLTIAENPPYCPSGDCDILPVATQTDYSDTNVLSDVEYFYEVTSVVGGIESTRTIEASGATFCFRSPDFIEQ